VGLDYTSANEDERACQKGYLTRYLPLVATRQTRIVVHCREGHTGNALGDLLEVMRQTIPSSRPVYVHHFVGSADDVEAWNAAFDTVYFGIPARYDHHNRTETDALLKVPLRRLLLESDCPYILSQPWDLTRVLDRVSLLLNMSPLMVAELTRANACRFYGLPDC